MPIDLDTPKYIQLKEHIKGSIKNGELKPGKKISSENMLAASFNMSRHTVRQAVGELVNEGWLQRVKGSGTYVTRNALRQKEKSRIIGVVTTYLNDYIFPDIIKGIDNTLSMQGYSMILGHTDNRVEKEAQCFANMLEKNVDGFIIEPTKSALPNPNIDFYNELDKRAIPYVMINGYLPGRECSYVLEDDEAGGFMAANHLIQLGHEKIGGVFKVDDIQGHGRYKGILKALKINGLGIPEDEVIWYTTEDVEAMFEKNAGKYILKRLNGITGLVCYNDQIALKLMEILRNEGLKVPDDISLVSFDDSHLASLSEPKLTTVAHPGHRLGEKAASGLLDLLKSNRDIVREVMQPELIVRNSTRRIGA